MTWFFSPSTRGFYTDELHDAWPDDAVEITAEQHAALLAGQAAGLLIQAGTDGVPALVAPPPAPAPPAMRRIATLAFRRRLAPAARAAITVAAHTAAAAGDATLQLALDDLSAARFVDLDDPEVAGLVATLQTAGLITTEQAAALLANGTPDEAA